MSTHRARKRFSQNFLTDEMIIDRIVKSLAPRPDQALVEIGPGQAALTRKVLPLCSQLDLIELDRDLIEKLERLCADYPFVNIHQSDILKFDFQTLYKNKPLRIFGNLPYNISSPILFHCLQSVDMIGNMLFMLQKEVVERLAAEPHCKSYGRLSVMVQFYCQVESLFDVPPTAFLPQPKVESAIVLLTPKPPAERVVANMPLFQDIVRTAFSQRRKMLRQSLKSICAATELERAGIDPRARAETLSVKDFVELTNLLYKDKT